MDYQNLNLDPDIIKKAVDGDPIAQVTLGKACFNAVYVENNCLNAFEWFSRAAEMGNMEAQFRLADLYALGQGTKQSHMGAHKWYTKAALQGYKKALIRIHNLYEQDKKMHCRGKINPDEEFPKYLLHPIKRRDTDYRDLNEQRLDDHKRILNNSIDHFTDQFEKYQSYNQEDTDVQLNLAFLYQHGYGVKKYTMRALKLYTKAAEQGDRDAQYNAAYLYHTSTNIKFNYRHSLRWYRTSATNGNVAAQNYLAHFYEKGLATDVNWEGALHWYTKAANAGSSSAQLTLGKLYRKGESVNQDFLEAAKWYELSAAQGNNAAKNCLEQLYQSGKVTNTSDIIAISRYITDIPSKTTLCSKLQKDIDILNNLPHFEQLKTLAMHALMTDGNAMYRVGLKYFNGEELPLDKDTGYLWIKRAAMAGLQEAILRIAKMHKEGDVVQQDYHTLVVWTKKGARRKNDKAQYNLGLLYKEGLGVRKDPLEASKWFIKASDQNNSDAQYQFGLLKLSGEGVRKDKDEAVKWFHTSALQGNPYALYILGRMNENGDSAEKDVHKVIGFYKRAAYFGSNGAQFELGRMYEEGKLVQKNLPRAHEYYTMSADSNNPDYQYNLAIKYINGIFDDPDNIKAFNLLKKAAERNHHRAKNIFQTPVESTYDKINYHNILNMFILASNRNSEGLDYNIGCAYEYGIDRRMDQFPFGTEKVFPIDFKNALEWYTSAANKGDSRAQYRLAVIYEDGEGVAKDLDKAFNYYNQAYSNGNTDAMYSLGLMYLKGEGVSQDLIQAFYLLMEASNLGHYKAREGLVPSKYSENLKMLESVANLGSVAIQYQLGELYKDEDDMKSFKWFTLAAEGGMIDAHYRLGRLYEEGKGTHHDYSKAIALYEKAIQKDHEEALYRLAELYFFGEIIECDYLRAYNLYLKAAKLGHTEAFKLLNETWDTTLSIEETNQEGTFDISSKKLRKVLSMLRFVAKQGDTDMQYQLGSFYERNEYNQSYPESYKWYRMAANNNHLEATYHLGLFYENGLGVTQDYSKAIQFYKQAKDQGSHDAPYRLGVIHHHGYGVEINHTKAINFYKEAAALGNSQSQYTLGRLYESGDLLQHDILKALAWYTKAHLNDNTSVIPELYNFYDHERYEYFFHDKLFQILSKLENSYKSDDIHNYGYYGSIYFRLGKMYLDGVGTGKNNAKALKHFLKAYYDYSYENAEPFITLNYRRSHYSNISTFIEMLNAYEEIQKIIPSEHLYKLGMLYYNGYSTYETDSSSLQGIRVQTAVPKNNLTVFQYSELVFKQHYAEALYNLGIILLEINNIDQAMECFGEATISLLSHECYDKALVCPLEKRYEMSLVYFKESAKSNNIQALAQLIIMYLEGNGVERNVDEAIVLIEKSLQLMSPYDCYNQGMKFYDGFEVDINYDIALMYLRKAAEKNDGKALSQLGIMFLRGEGVEKNTGEAMSLIEKSLQLMLPEECYHQGMKFYDGSGVDINYDISLMYLRNAAKNDNVYSQARLGYMYLNGIGVGKDDEQSKRWYDKVKRENFRKPALLIGQVYHYDRDGMQNFSKALKFYQKQLGNERTFCSENSQISSATQGMGLLYEYGDGVDQDYEKALKYYRKSATYPNNGALYNLGLLYYYGRGVEQNYKEAAKWFTLIFKPIGFNSNKYVHIRDKDHELGALDESTDREYSLQSEDIMYGEAQYYLGLMYKNGYGVAQNNDKSQQSFKNSFAFGIKHAKNFIQ